MDNASVDSKDEDDITELERKIRCALYIVTALQYLCVAELQRCLNMH